MNQTVTYRGTNFLGLLTIIFVLLRAFEVITWSWWWVFAPIWGPVLLVGLVLLGALIFDWFDNRKREKEREAARERRGLKKGPRR